MVDDAELLRRYTEDRSEEAFAELVRRHVNLVYSVARRQVGGDEHLAEDVVQTVFTALARKAASLVGRPVLGGWLYRCAQFTAIDVVRAERRRRAREEATRLMHDPLNASAAESADWEKLRPTLDEAIGELNDKDRDAIVLRFFEGKPFAEIGARLHLTENTARMRVDRALEKLHALLAGRGITSTTAALGVALAGQAGLAAPAGLSAAVAAGALTGATGVGGSAALFGAFLTMSKIKLGVAGAIVLAGAITAVVDLRANRALRAELGTLQVNPQQIAQTKNENRQIAAALGKVSENNPEMGELLHWRARAAVLRARPAGVVESAMKLASTWQDRGRATPEATWESFCHAVQRDDLDALASFLIFRDDRPEDRETFMAKFSDVVRARYRTPERLCAAAFFNGGAGLARSPDDAFQLLEVREIGPERVMVNTWLRRNGEEMAGRESYEKTADGWAIALRPLLHQSTLDVVLQRIDPATGHVRVERK